MYYIILNTYLYCHREHIANADLHIIFVPNPTYPFVRVYRVCINLKTTHTHKRSYHYSFIGQGRRFNPRACATIVYTFGYHA